MRGPTLSKMQRLKQIAQLGVFRFLALDIVCIFLFVSVCVFLYFCFMFHSFFQLPFAPYNFYLWLPPWFLWVWFYNIQLTNCCPLLLYSSVSYGCTSLSFSPLLLSWPKYSCWTQSPFTPSPSTVRTRKQISFSVSWPQKLEAGKPCIPAKMPLSTWRAAWWYFKSNVQLWRIYNIFVS